MTREFTERDLAAIERTTQEVGRYIFQHLARGKPTLLQRRWWDDRIMAWAMQDESVKVQMFRFIDVLPMLSTREAVTGHLQEYFQEVQEHLPSAVRLGLGVATPTRWPAGPWPLPPAAMRWGTRGGLSLARILRKCWPLQCDSAS
jgi:hypothetical protein